MFTRLNGKTRPDWSAITTIMVIIVGAVITYYTAIAKLSVKDAEIEGRIKMLEMTVELKLVNIQEKLDEMHVDIRRLQGVGP